MLRTKAMREKEEAKAKRRYKYCLIRFKYICRFCRRILKSFLRILSKCLVSQLNHLKRSDNDDSVDRVRFPDGWVLQGTFSVYETLSEVMDFVTEALSSPLPYLLVDSATGELKYSQSFV